MKKILVIILALSVASVCAYSRNVPEEIAALYAARFFGGKAVSSAKSVTKASAASGSEAPAYYLFNSEDGGFVIISGEDSTIPVFGYNMSECIDPDNMPPAMEWWLGTYEDLVSRNRDSGIWQTPDIAMQWINVGENPGASKAGENTVTCLTPEWNQFEPWNCKLRNSQWPVGCVATAISEIMCYYGYPDKGTGTVGGYTDENGNEFSSYTLSTTYLWDEIQKLQTEEQAAMASTEVKNNLGELLLDLGMALKMCYSTDGSGTTFNIKAMGDHFYYNKAAKLHMRGWYSHDQWYSMIKEQINAGHPIPYSGKESSGGHQFIFDGYDPDQYEFVHINWGWGGYGNGWFYLGSDFYGNQDMVTDFYPDKEQTSSYSNGDIHLQSYPAWLGFESYNPSTTITQGKSFNLDVGVLWNTGIQDFSGYIKAAHLDKNGDFVEFVSNPVSCTAELNSGAMCSFSGCVINEDINFGDKLAIYRSYEQNGDYEPILAVDDGSSVPTYPIRPLPFIDIKESYSVGDRLYLVLKNNDFAYIWSCFGDQSESHYSVWNFYNGETLVGSVSTETSERFFKIPSAGQYTVIVQVIPFGKSSPDHVICASFTVN